jgi:hypothetical protein
MTSFCIVYNARTIRGIGFVITLLTNMCAIICCVRTAVWHWFAQSQTDLCTHMRRCLPPVTSQLKTVPRGASSREPARADMQYLQTACFQKAYKGPNSSLGKEAGKPCSHWTVQFLICKRPSSSQEEQANERAYTNQS